MKTLILLHSTTGNTALVARYAAARLVENGHECVVHDILEDGEPELEDVDLLGVACPTMYFRPTWAMERFIVRLPVASSGPKPAFLIGTASGDPGSHFEILAELLEIKDYLALGARMVVFPDNWPLHRSQTRRLRWTKPVGEWLASVLPRSARGWYSTPWPELGDPPESDRDGLDEFLGTIFRKAEHFDIAAVPKPRQLYGGSFGTRKFGRLMSREMMAQAVSVRIHPSACTRCGDCVSACPVGCLTQPTEDDVPSLGRGCTGCWACYNHCLHSAISGAGAPAGTGRYPGPSEAARSLFETE